MTDIADTNTEELINYRHKFTLDNNVKLQLIFDNQSHSQRAIYYHQVHKREGRLPIITLKQYAYVDYNKGIMSDKLNLTYEVINHQNRGVSFFAGVDISKDSQIFLDINYLRNSEGDYVIDEIFKGAQCIYDAKENQDTSTLIKPAESPLDILTIIKPTYGSISIPLCLVDKHLSMPDLEIPLSIVE